MKRFLTREKTGRRGFTLVEMIVVVVVLAILTAILIPSVNKWIDHAKERTCLRNRREAEKEYNTFDLMNSGPGGGQTFENFLEKNGEPLLTMCPGGGTCTLQIHGAGTEGASCEIACSLHGD